MKINYKISLLFLFVLAGFLFFNINQTNAGVCRCCYGSTSEASTKNNCESICRPYGGWTYWALGDPGTTGETNSVACPPSTGSCFCCWAEAPESGEMEQSACISACVDKGSIKSFRSAAVSSLNLTRDCLPRPSEEIPGEETAPAEEETPGEETPSGESAPTGVLSGGLLKAAGRAGFESTSIENIVSNIIYVVLGFVGIIFLGLMLFAGFTWMTARGNEQDIEKAKKMIEAAIIGMVIVFAAYAITYFVTSRLLGETATTGGGSTTSCTEGETLCPCPGGNFCMDPEVWSGCEAFCRGSE